MNEVKILHTADLHIGSSENFLGERAKLRRAETLITFEKIVEAAKNENVGFFLIAGDLFDSNNVENQFVLQVFECIKNADKIKFIFAAGNHDPLDASSPFLTMKIPENLFVLDTEDTFFEFPEEKVRIYGKSFKETYQKGGEVFSFVPPDDDYVNIMCIHGEMTTDINSVYNAITPNFVKESKMDYIALGHIHKRTEIGKIKNTSFAYCGCPEGRGFDECGEKGVLLGTVKSGEVDLKFVNTAYRLHIREAIDISGALSSGDAAEMVIKHLISKYGQEYFENLYRITLFGEIEENVIISTEEISARLNEKVYFAKVNDNTEITLNYDLLKEEPTLKGMFTKIMLEKLENANEEEKETLKYALKLGLKSFDGEVTFNEN